MVTFDEATTAALKKIHDGGHILYREIGRICEKHGIHYYLDSGNLIGAVREKSDLRWDDDADISMTRADFEVFRKVAREELSEGFLFVEPQELGNAFFDFVPRVVLLDSQLKPDSEEERFYKDGIYNHMVCDIFIVDDVSDSLFFHRFCRFLQILVYGMSMGKRYRLDLSEYGGLSRIVIAVLSLFGKLFSGKTLCRWYDGIGKMEAGKNKKYGRCYFSNCLFPDLHRIFQKEWFASPVELTIDGEIFPGPCGYDRILRTLYDSDYMVPPDPESIALPHCIPEAVRLNYERYKNLAEPVRRAETI